ncbi:MAG: class I tRNA ligase family protein, partial [Clostridia bacterium]
RKGCLTEETKWAGVFCKDADKEVLQDLESMGLLFSAPKFEHSYPHCWRCDTPLIYYARESWFIKMTAVKEDMIRNNNTINWMPESIGKGRFGDWLENLQDWGISRNRYWGTPLNIWQCSCGHIHSIGSIEELKSMSDNCPDNIELHRPYIDEVKIKCSKCGGEMTRVPEVIDCWFDSGAMPFAQHHYPFENQDKFMAQFPADFISEAVDQTRGWFYSLLAISTLLFNKAPYKNVIVLGHVQDEKGQKMSKSKGNAVDPMEALYKYGADAIRWYFYSNSALWLPNRFHGKAVIEGQRKFLSTLWNTYAFYILYAEIDNFDPTKYNLDDCKLTVMDNWLLSKLNTLIKEVDEKMNDYKVQDTTKSLMNFVDEMSNWYVRRSRERFWADSLTEDKIAAYMTLSTALVEFCKLSAPLVPFITEEIYQNMVRSFDETAPISIHLCSYPVADLGKIDKELEENMEDVLKAVTLGRSARNDAAIKNRQPLAKLFFTGEKEMPEIYANIIKEELNVKAVEITDDASKFVTYTFKPQLKLLGKKYGKKIGEIRNALSALDGNSAKKSLDETGMLKITLSDGEIELSLEEVLIDTAKTEGFVSATENGMTVVLETSLTEELINEGMVREIVSKIQSMRKDAGFEVMDNINISVTTDQTLADIISTNSDSICSDVLGKSISSETIEGYTADWDINGHKASITVCKL